MSGVFADLNPPYSAGRNHVRDQWGGVHFCDKDQARGVAVRFYRADVLLELANGDPS